MADPTHINEGIEDLDMPPLETYSDMPHLKTNLDSSQEPVPFNGPAILGMNMPIYLV